jgi:alkanesulfonate monooxygenase SsuD/methylene tetrahydromethanopterin reductase-like flavin-dependent oxidoreductase (luciferase family)
MYESLRTHMKPVQLPHPPIGVTGLSKNSDTLKLAGERGFLPMSLNLNTAYVASHWDAVRIGAERTGRTPNRRDWRMVREVFVAETDEEAWRLSVGGMMGYVMREYFLPLYGKFNFLEYFKHDSNVADSDVTAEYCGKHNWIIGSPKTVTEQIERIFDELGGFGTLLVQTFDYSENPEAWRNSFRLLMTEVKPKVSHLMAK